MSAYSREWLDTVCHALPGTETDIKWGADLCYCIAAKMYCVTSVEGARPAFTVKASPDLFAELVARPQFSPAPYVGRFKWVRVDHPDQIGLDELADLIGGSWALIRSKLPKRVRDTLPIP